MCAAHVWLLRCSGITIPQIEELLSFVQRMVAFWTGTFGAERGQPLSYESFNLRLARLRVPKELNVGLYGPLEH